MSLMTSLILTTAKNFQRQRSTSAIFHLITGKRSIQTVQDAHLFGLDCFYGVLPKYSREDFDGLIKYYQEEGLLGAEQTDTYINVRITDRGEDFLQGIPRQLDYLKGLKYFELDDLFYKRLLLLTQVLTNHYQSHSAYIPVIDDPAVLQWVRKYYHDNKLELNTHMKSLHQDLHQLLSRFPEEDAEVFVKRLSGYKHFGHSLQQLSMEYGYSIIDLQILLRGIVHRLLQDIEEETVPLEFIPLLIEGIDGDQRLTKSAQITYQFLKNGYSIDQIISRRRLKESTILDHLVEISWYDQSFPVDHFISEREIALIKSAVEEAQSLQLKDIKPYLPEEISYFQIRIALTRIKNILFVGE